MKLASSYQTLSAKAVIKPGLRSGRLIVTMLLCSACLFAVAPTANTVVGQLLKTAADESTTLASALKQKPTTITITILYDNNEYDNRLETAWGFSCLVEGLEKTILFDTGGNSSMLLSNMRALGIDPQKVEVIVISHLHSDHVGGLPGFLEKNHDLSVFLPESIPQRIKTTVKERGAKLIEVHKPVRICENAYSTGELGTRIKEQSLLIKTSKGLIVITGCAHPGIVNIVKEAKTQLKSNVYLVLGGFHLSGEGAGQIKAIVNAIKKEGVKIVAPCHCSGDLARSTFKNEYGENFVLAGVGKRLENFESLVPSL